MSTMLEKNDDGVFVLNVGSSDENADWLKRIKDGKYQDEDIAAHDEAQRLHDEDTTNA